MTLTSNRTITPTPRAVRARARVRAISEALSNDDDIAVVNRGVSAVSEFGALGERGGYGLSRLHLFYASFRAGFHLYNRSPPQRHGRALDPIAPQMWRWREWKRHWRSPRSEWAKGLDPLADPLYRTLPANDWLTSDEILAKARRLSYIRWKWQIPRYMAYFVKRGLVECQEGAPTRYRKVEPRTGESPRPKLLRRILSHRR